ncbi:MAG: ATP-binding protein [Fuerstiella sp.]
MPKADDLTALFRAISAKDWATVEEAARGIAAREDRKGHHAAARALRGALIQNGAASRNGTPPFEAQQAVIASSLLRLSEKVDIADVRLKRAARLEIDRIVNEWKHRNVLKKKGLEARHRVLFHGPPGCGKSMTANALGNALGLPVFVARFDALVTSYLGQTAVNLRRLFSYVERTPCVLLVDELDALGRHRGARMDVGELDRIVIALMQELEHSRIDGLLVGTCNLPNEIDQALWRRFDVDIEFPMPTKTELEDFARQKAAAFGLRLNQSVTRRLTKGTSYATAEKLVAAAARNAVLKDL